MRIEGSNRRLSLHWTPLAEGNANFSIVIVFRYADDLMVGFERREEAERLQGIDYRFRALNVRKQKEGRRLRHESRDSPSFPTMYGGREALPGDHKFRGQRGRVRARYRRPQLGRGTEKIGEAAKDQPTTRLWGIFL